MAKKSVSTSGAGSGSLVIATTNVNGLRAAVSNGIGGWFESRRPDIVTMQEVRAPDDLVPGLVESVAGSGWSVAHHECASKGRAGVAVASRHPIAASRAGLEAGRVAYDDSGRWIEADVVAPDGLTLTVVSCYVHTGDAESPSRMSEKLAFLAAMTERLEALRSDGRHVVLTGDLNVAHREVDIKNWKGNLTKAGFLPEERSWFDDLFGRGWVDIGRVLGGEGPGPYTWWSWRGKAFDTDAGWRIDYQIATPGLAERARTAEVDRAPTYAERWSDHAPLAVTYQF
ncbi:MAG: hypothetical protein RJB65_318 [Actinomycetota bacterium]|jgi:exodeoxyribonuclease-3